MRRTAEGSEIGMPRYQPPIAEELDILQRNLESAHQPMPLHFRRNMDIKINTDKQEFTSLRHQIGSIERSPTKTEEYWSNYHQISPTLSSPSLNVRVPSNGGSLLVHSRSSSRLSAAKEILFGRSPQNPSAYEPGSGIARFNSVSGRPHSYIQGGFGTYIDQQEKIVGFQVLNQNLASIQHTIRII